MKRLIENAAVAGIVVLIVAAVGGLIYLDYSAYRQRFPDAAPWTYLFRGGK